MALIMLLGVFVDLSGFDLAIGLLGLLLFFGITAYDTQKMKYVFEQIGDNEATLEKISIYFALQLYLDFINIFLYLLRIMARSRN